ncbi:MAG TPA: UDP-forming cellulose synthase catalytic subunit [Geminicoccaceae bacterium]
MTPFLLTFWLLCATIVFWIGLQDVGLATQAWLALAAIASLLALRLFKPSGLIRMFILLLAAFVTLRYLSWRTFYSLPPVDSSGFAPGLILYLAELHAIGLYFLGMFANLAPKERAPARLPQHLENYPSVDVFIATYNEPIEILRITLTAATHIRYPKSRLEIFLLDDGGTDEKLHGRNATAAAAARQRADGLRRLCEELGVHYLTRRSNTHAKAGNINSALTQSSGDLVLVLDADHVPAQDILEQTVGHFLRDPKLALVQTPHFFVNPDPVERNLGTFYMMPSESEMFYQAVQKGLDFWNASMFCGSAAVLRRRHLLRVGGIATSSVTEDALTSLELHAAGYNSAYVDRPVVAGLAPETFDSFVTQRTRWAQGMVQILLLNNPLLKRGLTPAQRLCYLNSCLFWLFPFSRLVFVAAPLCYLFFGLRIFEATLSEFILFTLPHVLCSLMIANHLFGRLRWPFVSDLYELLLSLFTIRPVLVVLGRPRAPRFRVTPKGDAIVADQVTRLAMPVFILFCTLLIAALIGLFRYYASPLEQDHLTIVMAWNVVNLALALAGLGVMYERAGGASTGWILRDKPINVVTRSWEARGVLQSASLQAARLVIDFDQAQGVDPGERYGQVQIVLPGSGMVSDFPILIEREDVHRGQLVLDAWFLPDGWQDEHGLVALCFGDSAAWVAFQEQRQRERSLAGAFAALFMLGLSRSLMMAKAILFRERLVPVSTDSTAMVPYHDLWKGRR